MLKKILTAAAISSVAMGGLAAVPAAAQSYYQHDGYSRSYDRADQYQREEQYRQYQQEGYGEYGNRHPRDDDGVRFWHHDDRGGWGG